MNEQLRYHIGEYWPFYVTGAVTALCMAWVIAAMAADAGEYEAFMAECQQHEPTYQCTAKWRAGEN